MHPLGAVIQQTSQRAGHPAAVAITHNRNAHSHVSRLTLLYPRQGVAPELRVELWPTLLGVFSPDSTQVQRDAELERLRRWAG